MRTAQVWPGHHPSATPVTWDRHALVAGALTGQAAGLLMAVFMAAAFTASGQSPQFPLQLVGSLFFGEGALEGFHAGAFFTGLFLNQAVVSVFWGVMFAQGLRFMNVDRGAPVLAWAVCMGALTQIVDADTVMPVLFDALQGRNLWALHVSTPMSWAAHLVFGLGLALYPIVTRQVD